MVCSISLKTLRKFQTNLGRQVTIVFPRIGSSSDLAPSRECPSVQKKENSCYWETMLWKSCSDCKLEDVRAINDKKNMVIKGPLSSKECPTSWAPDTHWPGSGAFLTCCRYCHTSRLGRLRFFPFLPKLHFQFPFPPFPSSFFPFLFLSFPLPLPSTFRLRFKKKLSHLCSILGKILKSWKD